MCEDQILLHFYHQMLNERILKPNNETCLKCEHQIKQTTNSREKKCKLQLIER